MICCSAVPGVVFTLYDLLQCCAGVVFTLYDLLQCCAGGCFHTV